MEKGEFMSEIRALLGYLQNMMQKIKKYLRHENEKMRENLDVRKSSGVK